MLPPFIVLIGANRAMPSGDAPSSAGAVLQPFASPHTTLFHAKTRR
jgi:hypothetical protein